MIRVPQGSAGTLTLIILNLALWVGGYDDPLTGWGDLIGYAFTHHAWWHITINMVALLSFGVPVERRYGTLPMVVAYVGCAVAGGLGQLMIEPGVPVIGASGAVMGIMAMHAMSFPDRRVIIGPWRVLTRTFLLWYVVVEVGALLFSFQLGVAHWVHLFGIANGVALTWGIRRDEM